MSEELEARMAALESEVGRLRQAEYVFVSYGKSGRTWLRVLLTRFYEVRAGRSASRLAGPRRLRLPGSGMPRLFFTHDPTTAVAGLGRDPKGRWAPTELLAAPVCLR